MSTGAGDYALLTPGETAQRALMSPNNTRYVKWLLNVNVSKSLFKGAEISVYVNNCPGRPRHYALHDVGDGKPPRTTRNPRLFYGDRIQR